MLSPEENELLCRTGPGTPMGNLLRRFWIPAMLSEELAEPDCDPVRIRLLGENLLAFRDTEGRLGLIDPACAHRRADLYFGRNEESGIRCVYHGWKYDVDGNCIDMPTETEESNFASKVKIKSYPLREAGGALWTYMGPKELVPELPRLVFTQVPNGYQIVTKRIQETNYMQAIEGGIDSAHASYLHTTLDFYRRTDDYLQKSANSDDIDYRYRTADKAPRFRTEKTDYGITIAARRTIDEENFYWRFNQFLMPFYTMPPRSPAGHAFVPIDDENVWVWYFQCRSDRPYTEEEIQKERTEGNVGIPVDQNFVPLRNRRNNYLLDREMQRSYNFTGILSTGSQDQAVQESMGAITDRTNERLGVTDIGIIAMRQRLLDATKNLQTGIEPEEAHNADAFGIGGVMFIANQSLSFEEVVEHAKQLMGEYMPAALAAGAH